MRERAFAVPNHAIIGNGSYRWSATRKEVELGRHSKRGIGCEDRTAALTGLVVGGSNGYHIVAAQLEETIGLADLGAADPIVVAEQDVDS